MSRLSPVSLAARALGVTDDTLRRYIRKGYFPAYRLPVRRGLFVDVAQAKAALARQPRSRVRTGYGNYGPDARIIDVPTRGEAQ